MTGLAWRGAPEFHQAMTKMGTDALAATRAALIAAAAIGVSEAKASFGTGGGPQSDSGTLSGSIEASDPVAKGLTGYEVFFGPSGPYARRVELGKQGARSAAPHSYMVAGFARAAPQFIDVFRKAWTDLRR